MKWLQFLIGCRKDDSHSPTFAHIKIGAQEKTEGQ